MVSFLRLIFETVCGIAADAVRSRAQLVAENAMLRQQVINLRRKVQRPRLTNAERVLLILFARFTRGWQGALHIVKPDTLLRRHRDLFRLRWWLRSRPKKKRRPRKAPELVALIRRMHRRTVSGAANGSGESSSSLGFASVNEPSRNTYGPSGPAVVAAKRGAASSRIIVRTSGPAISSSSTTSPSGRSSPSYHSSREPRGRPFQRDAAPDGPVGCKTAS